jgi:hypothetical protein
MWPCEVFSAAYVVRRFLGGCGVVAGHDAGMEWSGYYSSAVAVGIGGVEA